MLGAAQRGIEQRNHAIALVVALVAIAVLPNFLKSYGVYLMTLFCVYLMATMGLNLTVGYAGQMSLGQAAFFGIGAYHAAILLKLGWPFFAVLPLAALDCFLVGLALGFPALRVQHHYLAFATLGFNILVYLVMRNEEKVTGGTFGISGIPRPSLFGYSVDGSLAFFYFTFVSVIVLGLVLWWLLRSPWGRAFAALRDNPIRAESLGINITAYTLLAFAIGAACAGIGGVYFAALVQFIEPAPFHVAASLTMLLAIIVGGSGRFFGPVLGTVVVVLLPEWLRFMQNWYLAVFGFAVVALMIWLPGGLCRSPSASRSRNERRRTAPRRELRPPGGQRSGAAASVGAHQMTASANFLEVKDMRKAYGAIKAVDGVTMSVGPGEIVGVIGPNGSGKTTLFNSILGQIRPTSGAVEFCGEDVTGMSPLELSRRGVGRTFQTLQVFGKLSVRDNLIVAAQEFKGSLPSRLMEKPDAGLGGHADEMIDLFRLKHVASALAGTLSYGQQKLIDIAMAFMAKPRLVLLDEPCAGVNPSLVDQLRELLVQLNKTQGGSFVVIEHNMDFVMKLCPHVICMVEGKVLAEGPPAAVQANRQVLEAYLGN